MTEQTSPLQFAQGGTPVKPDATPEKGAAQQQAEPGKPVYVTREEMTAELQKLAAQIQTQTGKSTVKLIEKKLAELKAANIQATPEQAAVLVTQELEAAQQSQPSQPPAAQPRQTETTDPVIRKAEKILKEAGIDPNNITKDHPDFSLIDLATDDPEDYLNSIRKFAQAAKTRADSAGSPAKLPTLAGGGVQAGGSKQALVNELNGLLADKPHLHIQRIQELRRQLSSMK